MERTFAQLDDDRVQYKVTFTHSFESVLSSILSNLGVKAPFLVISKSLASTPAGKSYLDFLSGTITGVKAGVGSYSPWEDAMDIAEQARSTKADSILTIGGGSITDACKLAILLLENVPSPIARSSISPLVNQLYDPPPPGVKPPTMPMIFIPTTLSTGEYHSYAGCLDREVGYKKAFYYSGMAARWIICDSTLASLTPEWVWLSTGLRAVDHAAESLCSTLPHDEKYDTIALNGLRLLLPGLLEVKQFQSQDGYSKCQEGAWNAIKPAIASDPVQLGASHAIGHKLGGVFGVPHGVTSCVMLPAVMKWNSSVNAQRQARIVEVFKETGVTDILKKEGIQQLDSAGDLLKGFVRVLGMPGSLTEVGVGPEKWDKLAETSLTDRWAKSNPRTIHGKADMFEIFELAK